MSGGRRVRGAERAGARATLLLSVHSTARGGAERCAVLEAERLARSYSLIIAAPRGPLHAELAKTGRIVEGPPLLPFWGGSPRRWAVQLVRSLRDAGRLARLIRRERVAGVVCNSSVALSPVLAARLTRRPVVIHLRDSPNSRLARPLVRLEAALATTVIAISDGLGALCGSRPRARVVRIADGIPIPPPPRPRPGFRDPLRLGVVGAIDRGKAQDVAVGALERLTDAGVGAELHLIGREQDDVYAAELRATARACGVEGLVHFHGQRGDLERVYTNLDLLLLPSRRDMTPLVVMEALARCLPVVATRVGSVPDLLLGGEAGLLVEPDDPEALTAAISTLRACPDLVRSLTARGRAHVAESYDVQTSLEKGCAEIGFALAGLRRGGIGDGGEADEAAPARLRAGSVPSRLASDQRSTGKLLSGR